MIGETGERKSAVATPDGKSRKKKKKKGQMFVARKSMWDFVVLKHGHESSQGVLISMILIMSRTLQRTLNHHPFARKL